jgi:raffinose/stachyose/melibiose transport system permease protein
MGGTRYTRATLARELGLIVVAAIFCLPFYLLIAIALDSTAQTYKTPLVFPWPPHFGNFATAWRTGGQGGLAHAMESSLIITVASVACLILFGSLCAYTLARRRSHLSNVVYILFVLAITLPFQLAIIPLFVAMRRFGLVGHSVGIIGIIVLNIGLLMPLTVLLYTGFIRALPRDYEEAARVDGARLLRSYARVVFPLLRPVTGTVAVLLAVIVWNEFFVTLIFLAGSRFQTLPVALYSFAGDYAARWNLVFAGVAIAIAPLIGFFVFAQRELIRGFTAGVKG